MAFTMHSHSGEFCPGHAKDQLEEIVQRAVALGYTTMALTEHMPRTSLEDLYPEELDDPTASLAALPPRHAAFLAEAARLRAAYDHDDDNDDNDDDGSPRPRIRLLVGFEAEWLRPLEYLPYVRALASDPRVDFFVGSLHHVDGVPIDFDADHYSRAVDAVHHQRRRGGHAAAAAEDSPLLLLPSKPDDLLPEHDESDGKDEASKSPEERLAERYYDQQHDMLRALRPRVVGHFDLVRLLSASPGRDVSACGWPGVWRRVRRNLALLAADKSTTVTTTTYSSSPPSPPPRALLECNTSALRKGLAEPYPSRPVAAEWLRLGGRFTLSDDSHGLAQVGTNYARGLDYLASLGVESVWKLERRRRRRGSRQNGDVEEEEEDTAGGRDEVDADKSDGRLVEVEVPLREIREVVGRW